MMWLLTLPAEVFDDWQKALISPPPAVDFNLWFELDKAFVAGTTFQAGENYVCRE